MTQNVTLDLLKSNKETRIFPTAVPYVAQQNIFCPICEMDGVNFKLET